MQSKPDGPPHARRDDSRAAPVARWTLVGFAGSHTRLLPCRACLLQRSLGRRLRHEGRDSHGLLRDLVARDLPPQCWVLQHAAEAYRPLRRPLNAGRQHSPRHLGVHGFIILWITMSMGFVSNQPKHAQGPAAGVWAEEYGDGHGDRVFRNAGSRAYRKAYHDEAGSEARLPGIRAGIQRHSLRGDLQRGPADPRDLGCQPQVFVHAQPCIPAEQGQRPGPLLVVSALSQAACLPAPFAFPFSESSAWRLMRPPLTMCGFSPH